MSEPTPIEDAVEEPARHPLADAVLMRRLRTMVENYHRRCGAATPMTYARSRLALRQADMMVLAEALVAEGSLVILERHFLPAGIAKNSA